MSVSYNLNHGDRECRGYNCPLGAEARGLDDNSTAVVEAFLVDGFLSVKSAGNMKGCSTAGGCLSGAEVSAPGASPGALSVGALATSGMNASEIQRSDGTISTSSGGNTPDGRSYPLMVAAGSQCGCGSPLPSASGLSADGYNRFNGTSAATPSVAGAALLIKHWLIEQYGSAGASAGAVMVNMLNFADGFAIEHDSSPPVRVDPPAPWWGLGRLRMRLFNDAQDSRGPYHGTTSFALFNEWSHSIDITPDWLLPSNVRHLRVTAWWVEVNTGVGEEKATIRMSLTGTDFTTTPPSPISDVVETSTEEVLRLQYDRDDVHFPCPPSGVVSLYVEGVNIPREVRSTGMGCRVIYVAWFWETGEDPTQLLCGGIPASLPCSRDDSIPVVEMRERDYHEAVLLSMRRSADVAIRETISSRASGSITSSFCSLESEVKCSTSP